MKQLHLKDLRIVFMGTPEFAVASLSALVDAGCNIVGVITAPDKPAGRGMKLTESAVKKFAVAKNLRVLQPPKLKEPSFVEDLRVLRADVQVVVAFRMLPEIVWSMPRLGTINVHGSLLPDYRGAAPINWAVINGDSETGVTTFRLKHEIDTGNILMQRAMPIELDETAGEIHDKMKELGASVLLETLENIIQETIVETPQVLRSSGQRHAPKLTSETGRIDWHQDAKKIHDLIRGLSPFPGAFTTLHDKTVKIYRSKWEKGQSTPGQIDSDGKTFLRIGAADGWIYLENLQMEGKKRMDIADFLRGYRFPVN